MKLALCSPPSLSIAVSLRRCLPTLADLLDVGVLVGCLVVVKDTRTGASGLFDAILEMPVKRVTADIQRLRIALEDFLTTSLQAAIEFQRAAVASILLTYCVFPRH